MTASVPPITICFLIECAVSAKPGANIWPGGWESPAGVSTRNWLKANGLIAGDHSITARGSAWLEAIQATPLPEGHQEAMVLPQDVIDLVIAARIVAFEDQSPRALRALDAASEAFASRVPWQDDPEVLDVPASRLCEVHGTADCTTCGGELIDGLDPELGR